MELKSRIENRSEVTAICYRLVGSYPTLDYALAWQHLMEYCREKQLPQDCSDAEYLNLYLDDCTTTPAEQCRVDVCIASQVVKGLEPSSTVGICTIEGGRYIVYLVKGDYKEVLAPAYQQIYGKLLKQTGVELLPKPMFEKYLNDPETTAPEELLTEIWIPIAG